MAGEDFYGNIPKDNTFEAQEMAADIMGFKFEFDIESASGYVRMIDKNLFQYCEGVHVRKGAIHICKYARQDGKKQKRRPKENAERDAQSALRRHARHAEHDT